MYVEVIFQLVFKLVLWLLFEIMGNFKIVMKESFVIVYSFVKLYMVNNFFKNDFLDYVKIYVYVFEGVVQKDGLLVGIMMVMSLLSLVLDRQVDLVVVMMGELMLMGKVLRIGGLREKIVVVRRVGCKMVLFLRDNESDWLELFEVSLKFFFFLR